MGAAKYVAGPAYRGNPGDDRKEGDHIPEAENWTQVGVWLSTGHLKLAGSVEAVPSQPPAAQPGPAEETTSESVSQPAPSQKRRGRPAKKKTGR